MRISSYIFFQILFRSHFTCEYRLPLVANIEPLCGISIAPLAQISIYLNIPSSTVAATTVPLLHKDCSFGRNRAKVGIWVDSRRDGGPPDSFVTLSACHLSRYRESLPHKARQSRAGEGWYRNAFDFPFRGRRRVAETGNRSVNADGRVLFRT